MFLVQALSIHTQFFSVVHITTHCAILEINFWQCACADLFPGSLHYGWDYPRLFLYSVEKVWERGYPHQCVMTHVCTSTLAF